jgi:hypothetical protein
VAHGSELGIRDVVHLGGRGSAPAGVSVSGEDGVACGAPFAVAAFGPASVGVVGWDDAALEAVAVAHLTTSTTSALVAPQFTTVTCRDP